MAAGKRDELWLAAEELMQPGRPQTLRSLCSPRLFEDVKQAGFVSPSSHTHSPASSKVSNGAIVENKMVQVITEAILQYVSATTYSARYTIKRLNSKMAVQVSNSLRFRTSRDFIQVPLLIFQQVSRSRTPDRWSVEPSRQVSSMPSMHM